MPAQATDENNHNQPRLDGPLFRLTQVALEKPVLVRLPFPVALQTCNASNLLVTEYAEGAAPLTGVLNYDTNVTRSDAQTMLFTPDGYLKCDTTYVVTIKPGVRCWRRGQPILEEEVNFTFSTRHRPVTSICFTAPQPARGCT